VGARRIVQPRRFTARTNTDSHTIARWKYKVHAGNQVVPYFTLKQAINIALALLITALSLSAYYYSNRYIATRDKLLLLEHDVSVNNKQASDKLKQLTVERDAKQLALNELHKKQEEKDERAKIDIQRITNQLRSNTVLVRVKPSANACDRVAAADTPTNAVASAADTDARSGILSDVATERLASAIIEIETMSAAYSSCKAKLSSM
jgi:hypothetical protein